MNRRLRLLVLCVVIVAGLLVVCAPAAAAVSITITAPTGAGSYVQCSTLPASWVLSPSVATGQCGLWIVGPAGKLYAEGVCTPSGKASYTYNIRADAPVGSGYRVVMRYRTSSTAPWGAANYSPGAFEITPPVMPFETLVYSLIGESAVTGLSHPFGFFVLHPDPNAIVTSAKIIFVRSGAKPATTSVPISGISRYVIETEWLFDPVVTPSNTFLWTKCTLGAGTYRWYVLVTINGATNTMHDAGTLRITRR